MGEAVALRGARGFDGARDHGVERHLARILGLGGARIFVHHAGEQLLIERSPIDADAHRLVVLDRDFDHGAKIVVRLAAYVRVAGIDAVLGQGARALRIFLQQDVAVVVEVADDGHARTEQAHRLDDLGNGCRGVLRVDGDAHQLRAGSGKRHHLVDRAGDIGRIGVGHRLHDNRMIAADRHASYIYDHRLAAGTHSHRIPSSSEDSSLPAGGRELASRAGRRSRRSSSRVCTLRAAQ